VEEDKKWVKLEEAKSRIDTYGSENIIPYEQEPSDRDLSNAESDEKGARPHNFVVSRLRKKVFYYTPNTKSKGKTNEGTFKLEDFYNRKEGEHEEK